MSIVIDGSGTISGVNATGITTAQTAPNGSITQVMLATAVVPLGAGQTWTDVTSSRALGTTYTNSTGRPIMIAIAQNSTASGGFGGAITIAGVGFPQNYSYASSAGYINWLTYIVPNGATYSCASNATSLNAWFELR